MQRPPQIKSHSKKFQGKRDFLHWATIGYLMIAKHFEMISKLNFQTTINLYI